MTQDPSLLEIDLDQLNRASDAAIDYAEETKKRRETEAEHQAEEQAQETQGKAELADPRNADKWGLKAIAKEFESIGSGGIQDTLSSVATFPESVEGSSQNCLSPALASKAFL